MTRRNLHFAIDVASLVAMSALVVTGAVMRFGWSPGGRGGCRSTVWGAGRHQWGDLHFWLAVTVVALLAIHLVLHSGWIRATARSVLAPRRGPAEPLGRRALVGYAAGFVAALVVILAGFLAVSGGAGARRDGAGHPPRVEAGARPSRGAHPPRGAHRPPGHRHGQRVGHGAGYDPGSPGRP